MGFNISKTLGIDKNFFNQANSSVGFGPTTKMGTNPQPMDPRYTSLVSNLGKSAKDYRTRMPAMVNDQVNIAKDTSRMDLAKAYVDADRGANRRGMLYGGVRAGMRANAESDASSGLASKIRGINIGQENSAQGQENTAIEAAQGMQSEQQQLYQNAYNEALSKREQEQKKKSGIFNQIGGGVGGMLGGMLGGGGGGGGFGGLF